MIQKTQHTLSGVPNISKKEEDLYHLTLYVQSKRKNERNKSSFNKLLYLNNPFLLENRKACKEWLRQCPNLPQLYKKLNYNKSSSIQYNRKLLFERLLENPIPISQIYSKDFKYNGRNISFRETNILSKKLSKKYMLLKNSFSWENKKEKAFYSIDNSFLNQTNIFRNKGINEKFKDKKDGKFKIRLLIRLPGNYRNSDLGKETTNKNNPVRLNDQVPKVCKYFHGLRNYIKN